MISPFKDIVMQEFIEIANTLADEAAKIIRAYFREPIKVETKEDKSPVTIADRKAEEAMRTIIEKLRPEDGILGEEYGTKESKNGFMWVLDPIDGTKSFMIGRPTFGTLIALCENNIPKIGIIDQPILGERWVSDGSQTFMNGSPVETRTCRSLEDARIGSTTPVMFDYIAPYGRAYELFETGSKMVWGGDCYMYGLIASGYMDMAFEANLSPYDFAALVPIIKGAGGHISDWRGDPLTLKSNGKIIALGDPALWPEVERIIKKSPY